MAVKDQDQERYNTLKSHGGKRYSGMKVGGTHKWYYDQGVWKERKVTPDEWDIFYSTVKRRAGKAPKGTGAPVGTEYNWLIVAHQRVDKLDENSYMTILEGKKFKIAHKRATKDKWSTSEKNQRKRTIAFLEQVIDDLKAADPDEETIYTIGDREKLYGIHHMTVAELNEMAAEYEVSGRSKLNKEELIDAILEAHKLKSEERDQAHQEKEAQPKQQVAAESDGLQERPKEQLYEMARRRKISGRSRMSKRELVKALR